MKILKSFIAFAGILGLMSLTSCTEDWGQQDPPAGTDVYPTKELVSTYNFEYDEAEPLSDLSAYVGGVSVVQDEVLGSNVLHLEEGSYVRIANPFVGGNGLQNGAAITMWLRTDSVTRHPSFIAFGDEDCFDPEKVTEKFTFTENSWLSYSKPGQLETLNLDENNPDDVVTGAITDDQQWHFFALQITSDGYVLYIDGEKKAQQDKYAERNTQFSYSQLLNYLETAPYLYIGTPNEPYLSVTDIDDITFYRNQMDKKDWNKSLNGGSGEDDTFNQFFLLGNEDNSSPFFGPKTPNLTLNGDGVMHYKFRVVSTKGVNNYETWVLAITNGVEFGGAGYTEYEICRGDAWCWGTLVEAGAGCQNSYNWDTWRTDMAGATVELTITRTGDAFHVDQYVTTAGGKALPLCTWDCSGASGATWGTFITLEACCLEFDKTECYVTPTYAPGTKTVGQPDLTSGFFADHSEVYKFDEKFCKTALRFINYSSMGANWDNYVIAFTNDVEFQGDGYHEYAVLRSDAFGWGEEYNAEHLSASYDWSTYTTDMNGADVTLEFTRINDRFDLLAKQISSSGAVMPDMTYYFDDTVLEKTTPMHVFITGEQNYMDFLEIRTYPFMNYTPEE